MNTENLFQKSNRSNAAIIGWLFIAAAVFSIAGLKLYDPVLAGKDFLHTGSDGFYSIISGVICELILCVSAIGTGVMLYPYLKKYNESIGVAYLSFRIMEVVFIVLGIISMLTVLSVCLNYQSGSFSDEETAQSVGRVFIAAHDWTFILGPNFMLAINTFIYSYIFIRTGLVPRKLAVMGLFASCLIMLAALGEMFGLFRQMSIWGILLAIPIAVYEMYLSVHLIRTGFTEKLNV